MSSHLDSRPAKRSRSSEDVSYPKPSSLQLTDLNLTHHAEFWLDDGNIVLVAGGTAFRIYRRLLALQSTVFADMFASASSNLDEMYEGCPIVHLSDSPQDLAHLLRALLPIPPHFRYNAPVQPTFDEISAVIRLTHKYHIQEVEDQALALLCQAFSPTFDALCDAARSEGENVLRVGPIEAIGVVNIARLTDTPALLLLALYCCAYLDSQLLDGWKRDDGTVEHLSQADLGRCMDARLKLMVAQTGLLDCLFDDRPSAGCKRGKQCAKTLRDLRNSRMVKETLWTTKVLDDWAEFLWSIKDRDGADDSEMTLCEACKEDRVRASLEEQRRVWDLLPGLFDIEVDGWSQAVQ